MVLAIRVVHGVQHPREPAAPTFHHDDAQLRMPLEHARAAEVGDRLHRPGHGDDVVDDRTARPMRGRLRAARAGVEGERYAELLGRGPERVVGRVVVRAEVHVRGQHRAAEAAPRRAPELLHRRRDVVHGEHRHRREALRGGDELFGDPLVVEARGFDLELRAPDVEAAEEGEVRVDDLAPHAVGVEVAEPAGGVARAVHEGLLVRCVGRARDLRKGREAPHHRVLDQRAVRAELRRKPARPQVDRLHDVRVGRDEEAPHGACTYCRAPRAVNRGRLTRARARVFHGAGHAGPHPRGAPPSLRRAGGRLRRHRARLLPLPRRHARRAQRRRQPARLPAGATVRAPLLALARPRLHGAGDAPRRPDRA